MTLDTGNNNVIQIAGNGFRTNTIYGDTFDTGTGKRFGRAPAYPAFRTVIGGGEAAAFGGVVPVGGGDGGETGVEGGGVGLEGGGE